jgi:hypothetical protein
VLHDQLLRTHHGIVVGVGMNLNHEVFLVAAEMIEGMERPPIDPLNTEPGPVIQWCCDAIKEACRQMIWEEPAWKNAAHSHIRIFGKIFKPEVSEAKEQGSLSFSVWWLPQDRSARLTALTMAAAIVAEPK